jgi:hypothetical protein
MTAALCAAGAFFAASAVHAQEHVAASEGSATQSPPAAACHSSLEVPRCARLIASVRFGLAEAPFVTTRLPEVRGHGFVGLVAAALALNRHYAVGVDVPFAVVSIEQPAGSYVDESTRGNLGLFVRATTVWSRPHVALAPFAELALGLPLAERDAEDALLASRALAIASALEMYRRQDAFTSGTVPVTTSLGVCLRRGVWSAETSLRMPLLFRFSNAGLPAGADTRPVGFAPALHLQGGARPLPWLYASFTADLVVNAVAPVRLLNEPTVAQLSLTPALLFSLQRHVSLGLDFVAPIAGPLGGWNYSGSLYLVTVW